MAKRIITGKREFESDKSNRFNPKLPPAGRQPFVRKKTKAGIDPDAFSDDTSARFNPKLGKR